MELWSVFLILAVVCATIGILRSKGSSARASDADKVPGAPEGLPLVRVWSEADISREIAALREKPTLLARYVSHLKERFIINTDAGTARVRTEFLRTRIEQLDVSKQYQNLVNDLRAMEAEQQNRLLKLELERRDLEAKTRQADALEKLRLEKERLSLEVEIGQMRAQKRAIQNPPPEASLNPEQQRRLKRMEIEDRMEQLDRDEASAVKKARNDEDRARIQNMYADKREELREQLGKHLV